MINTENKNKTHTETEKVLELMGFTKDKIKVDVDEEHRKISILIDDDLVRGNAAPEILSALNHLLNLVFKKDTPSYYVVDLNYYRKERERLISELARAAAKKATMTKEIVELPPMNSYERRLVHIELKTHPELGTESAGQGKDRHVVVRHLQAEV